MNKHAKMCAIQVITSETQIKVVILDSAKKYLLFSDSLNGVCWSLDKIR